MLRHVYYLDQSPILGIVQIGMSSFSIGIHFSKGDLIEKEEYVHIVNNNK